MGWEEKYSNPETWANSREKITLVCTSLNPNKELLHKMFVSAQGFDNFILHVDEDKHPSNYGHPFKQIGRVFSDEHLSIPYAYNKMIEHADTEWVCCFCDDDYFYPKGLAKMISAVHMGIDADVAHFKFRVSGYTPKEDIRGQWHKLMNWGNNEYILGEKKPITEKLLEKHNRLPAGSFFRKSAWKKVDGFKGDKCHDWDLWKRMAQAGCRFKYFDILTYNMVRRPNSAWIRQNAKR